MGSNTGTLSSLLNRITTSRNNSSSSSSSSSPPNPTGIFTGSSAYSSDLSNAITRPVNIASLPIQQLTNEQLVIGSTSQMAAADAAIASTEQPFSEITQLYQAQRTAALQYANGR